VLDFLANTLTTLPGILILCLLGLLVISIMVGVYTYSAWREVSLHLHSISLAMDEHSRLLEKMRRSFADVMEVAVALEATPRQRAWTEPDPSPSSSAAGLREELELLKAEISSDLSVGPAD
jgi:hypothetical protein